MPNRDASKLAVGIYAKGSEIQDFRIIDSRTGAAIGEPITGLNWFGWARDERYGFLSPRTAESDAKQEPHKCYRHRLGSDRKDDELLITMKDAKEFCQVYEPEEADYTVFETGDFYVEHDPHPPARLDRGAADDLLAATSTRRMRCSARTASTSAPTPTRRTGS